jgi:hypothetical protein
MKMSNDNKARPFGIEKQKDISQSPAQAVDVSDQKLHQALEDHKKDILEQIQKEKTDFVTVVSIFASAIAFLTVEFQFLKTLHSIEKILGFSMVLWSLLISFNVAIILMLDHMRGRQALALMRRNWFLGVIVGFVFVCGVSFTFRGNEETTRENKIYARFSGEYDDKVNEFEKRLMTMEHNG